MKHLLILISLCSIICWACNKKTKPESFKTLYEIPHTPVKHQGTTWACWNFATCSFLESEYMRKYKDTLDLSEKYILNRVYQLKSRYCLDHPDSARFVRGGQAHDAIHAIQEYGMVPGQAFSFSQTDLITNTYGSLYKMLKDHLKNIDQSTGNKNQNMHDQRFTIFIDSLTGFAPDSFYHKNNYYTPYTFAEDMLNMDFANYSEYTSYKELSYFQNSVLPVPDNWSLQKYVNLPVDSLYHLVTASLEKGYSFVWDGDITEPGFNQKEGMAHLSEEDHELIKKEGMENARQLTFDNRQTTDDHLMHCVGLAEGDNDQLYFIMKDSYGSNNKKYKGYIYMSKDYFQLKTIAVMMRKIANV